jgi:hypothetical protein
MASTKVKHYWDKIQRKMGMKMKSGKGIDPKDKLSKEELQDPIKVQNLAPEAAKKCERCGQEVPGAVDQDEQKSGKFDDVKEPEKPKMRHGAY